MDKLIITKDDIKLVRPTADLEPARIEPYILEAQDYNLRPVLNDALYYDLITKFDNANPMQVPYLNLINGTTYPVNGSTVQYKGLKYMLAYFALARYVQGNDTHYARFGTVKKTLTSSEPISSDEKDAERHALNSNGVAEQLKLKTFLDYNKATYPLWGVMHTTAEVSTGLNFFGFGTNPKVRR